MANRYIPFGYEITDAEVVIIEREAEVVRNVFSLYVQGNSLKSISDRLNLLPVSYAGDGRLWDKNIVKRILENKKYIGDKAYPVIIPPETAELALKCKDKKGGEITAEEKCKLDAYRKMTNCGICGSKMARKHAGSGKNRRIYWQCTNRECDGSRHMFRENILDRIITELLNELADDLEMIEYTEEKDYERDTEVIRLTNEINDMISSPKSETADVIEKIMSLAAKKFDMCKVGDNTEITKSIKTELAIFPQKESVDGNVVSKIISVIKMYPDKHVRVQLINGKEFERPENLV